MTEGEEEGNPEEDGGEEPIRTFIMNKKEVDDDAFKRTGHDNREAEVRILIQSIQDDFNGILERRKKVEGVGMLYIQYGKFGDFLGELFELYKLGYFNSTILLCGTLVERICYDFIDFMEITTDDQKLDAKTKKPLYKLSFRDLVDFLIGLNYIDKKSYGLLHEIYNIRNRYVHLTEGGDAESDSIKALNKTCRLLEYLFDINKYYQLKEGTYHLKNDEYGSWTIE